jgi:hypothetical protein|tara:strand:+ start:82 stop:309 length:228 start_codon:yes stop_codon:yes gene_type:complete
MSYIPNNLSDDEVKDITAALEAAHIHAMMVQRPVILKPDLKSVALNHHNATMALEIIEPIETADYVDILRRYRTA